MKEKLVQGIFHTYIGIVVTTFGSSFFGLAINSNLLELSCNSTPDNGFPSALGLVTHSLLFDQCVNEDLVVLCEPMAAFWFRHVDGECISRALTVRVIAIGVGN